MLPGMRLNCLARAGARGRAALRAHRRREAAELLRARSGVACGAARAARCARASNGWNFAATGGALLGRGRPTKRETLGPAHFMVGGSRANCESVTQRVTGYLQTPATHAWLAWQRVLQLPQW